MYEILISELVRKQIAKIPQRDLEKIKNLVKGLGDVPRPFKCKKLAGGDSEYRIRHGDWRILYSVDDKKSRVVVYGILHRREAYR